MIILYIHSRNTTCYLEIEISYPGLRNMKQREVSLYSFEKMLVHRRLPRGHCFQLALEPTYTLLFECS